MATINPTTMRVGDPPAATEGVTAFKVSCGTASGGPYAAAVATAPIGGIVPNNGVYDVPMSQLTFSPPLINNTVYFAVCQAEGAGGVVSGNSPEASFQISPPPSAPVSLAFV